jgi:hypothetical protein
MLLRIGPPSLLTTDAPSYRTAFAVGALLIVVEPRQHERWGRDPTSKSRGDTSDVCSWRWLDLTPRRGRARTRGWRGRPALTLAIVGNQAIALRRGVEPVLYVGLLECRLPPSGRLSTSTSVLALAISNSPRAGGVDVQISPRLGARRYQQALALAAFSRWSRLRPRWAAWSAAPVAGHDDTQRRASRACACRAARLRPRPRSSSSCTTMWPPSTRHQRLADVCGNRLCLRLR